MMALTRRLALTTAAGSMLTACGSSASRLKLSIQASAQLNPGPEGDPAPLALRFLELTSVNAFMTAPFAALFYNPSATLRSDLLDSFPIDVTPSSDIKTERVLNDQTQFVGIVAGYREIDDATWRMTQTVRQGRTTTVTLIADRLAISVAPKGGWF